MKDEERVSILKRAHEDYQTQTRTSELKELEEEYRQMMFQANNETQRILEERRRLEDKIELSEEEQENLLSDEDLDKLYFYIVSASYMNEDFITKRIESIIDSINQKQLPFPFQAKSIVKKGERSQAKSRDIIKATVTVKQLFELAKKGIRKLSAAVQEEGLSLKEKMETSEKRQVQKVDVSKAVMTKVQVLEIAVNDKLDITEENYNAFLFRGMMMESQDFLERFLHSSKEERKKLLRKIEDKWQETVIKPLKQAKINCSNYEQLVFMGIHIFGEEFVSMLVEAKTKEEKENILRDMQMRWNNQNMLQQRLNFEKSKEITALAAFTQTAMMLLPKENQPIR